MRNMASALLTKKVEQRVVNVPFEDGELTFVEPNGRAAITMLANLSEELESDDAGADYEAGCKMIQLTWVDENGANVLGVDDYKEFLDTLTLSVFKVLVDGAKEVCEGFLATDSKEATD